MGLLWVGLALFLGIHLVRIVAPGWRRDMIESLGKERWKGLYSVISVVGLVLIIWGYSRARAEGAALVYAPPPGMRHAAYLLTLVAFILFAAANTPANRIKAWVRHPMALGTATWAIAHLMANGMNIDLYLFGAFALWGLAAYVSALLRQPEPGVAAKPYRPSLKGDLITVGGGAVIWALFAFMLHRPLIGVAVA